MSIYQPNIQNGEELFKRFQRTNGAELDFSKPKIIPYTWKDFTDLVAYERQDIGEHTYSSMMAINLMKGNLSRKPFYYPDLMGDSWEYCFNTFLIECYMKVNEIIPKWDYTTGNYFDKFFDKYGYDVLRKVVNELSGTTDIPIKSWDEDAQKEIIHKRTSLSLDSLSNSNEDNGTMKLDMIENKILAQSEISGGSSTYSNPEDIVFQKLEAEGNNKIIRLFSMMEEYDNFTISSDLATIFVFMEKFLNKDIFHNDEISRKIINDIAPIFIKNIKEMKDETINSLDDNEVSFE